MTLIAHQLRLEDGTQLEVFTDGQRAYPAFILTPEQWAEVNQQLAEMGLNERLAGTWN